MPKQPTVGKDAHQVRAEYPISDAMEGWFFRTRSISQTGYVVEGMDLWGRVVSRQGDDPEVLLTECIRDAREIEDGIKRAF